MNPLEYYERFAGVAREAIAAPMANLSTVFLLLAALTVVLLIIVTGIALVVLPPPRRPHQDVDALPVGVGEHMRGSSSRLSWRKSLSIAFLVLIALALGYWGTGTDEFCLSCHAEIHDRSGLASADATPSQEPTPAHAQVDCVRCHEEPLPAGVVSNVAARVRFWFQSSLGRSPQAEGVSVPSRRCLGCHRDILPGVTVSAVTGVTMSHAEPVNGGVPCVECHKDTGHHTGSPGVSMNTCLTCHDGERAPSECASCHTKDVALAARSRRTFSYVHLPAERGCGGCHDQRVCDGCHGLRMPHQSDFVDGEHARYAGFEKKELCWRCHTLGDCSKCHAVKESGMGAWGHGTGDWWRRMHGRVTPEGAQAGCGCHGRSRYARDGNYCKACH